MVAIQRIAAVMSGLLVFAGLAQAQDSYQGPWEKFSISLGGFISESDTTVQINSKTLGAGAVLDLENALGVEQSFKTYRIDAKYRFGETRRHEVELHYFDSKRDGSKTLDRELVIGDERFPVGAGVNTEFELRFINVDYVYNFLMDDRVRLGVSAGLHTTGISLKVQEALTGGKVEEESFTAPLPMIGFRSEILLPKRWRLRTDFNVFYLEFDRYTGRLADLYFGVEWNPWKNFGFGAGLNAVNYNVEADGDELADFSGDIEYSMTGALLYGRYFF